MRRGEQQQADCQLHGNECADQIRARNWLQDLGEQGKHVLREQRGMAGPIDRGDPTKRVCEEQG